MDPSNPIDVAAERIAAWIDAQVLDSSIAIDPDLHDLAAVALWDRLETMVAGRHREYVRRVKANGRTWDDIAASLGLARGSSAESRYTLTTRNRNRQAKDGRAGGNYSGRPPEASLKRADLRGQPPRWLRRGPQP